MLVIYQDLQNFDCALLDQAKRIVMSVLDRIVDHSFLRQADLAVQRGQDLGLVLEMPVDRTARYACALGNLFEARAADAVFIEDLGGGCEDFLAGLGGIFL
ncbi:conserved hypothetical protein, partial [Ricinus communis]